MNVPVERERKKEAYSCYFESKETWDAVALVDEYSVEPGATFTPLGSSTDDFLAQTCYT